MRQKPCSAIGILQSSSSVELVQGLLILGSGQIATRRSMPSKQTWTASPASPPARGNKYVMNSAASAPLNANETDPLIESSPPPRPIHIAGDARYLGTLKIESPILVQRLTEQHHPLNHRNSPSSISRGYLEQETPPLPPTTPHTERVFSSTIPHPPTPPPHSLPPPPSLIRSSTGIMKLDKLAPIAPSDPLANSNNKPKKWANVRRKFALIVANRNSAPPPAEEPSAVAQAESFCRPYIQDPPAPGMPAPEPDREFEFARLTKENSARNKEITSPSYSAPKTAAAGGRTKKKKKGASKVVRFIEEPFIIQDNGDRASIESIEAGAEADGDEYEDEGEDEDEDEENEEEARGAVAVVPEHVVGVKPSQQRAGSGLGGLATIRVVRQ